MVRKAIFKHPSAQTFRRCACPQESIISVVENRRTTTANLFPPGRTWPLGKIDLGSMSIAKSYLFPPALTYSSNFLNITLLPCFPLLKSRPQRGYQRSDPLPIVQPGATSRTVFSGSSCECAKRVFSLHVSLNSANQSLSSRAYNGSLLLGKTRHSIGPLAKPFLLRHSSVSARSVWYSFASWIRWLRCDAGSSNTPRLTGDPNTTGKNNRSSLVTRFSQHRQASGKHSTVRRLKR